MKNSRFQFSPTITITCLLLASLMLTASQWQWSRYKYKVKLLETYAQHESTADIEFPYNSGDLTDYSKLIFQKVKLSGEFDYSRQVIIINRRHETGPGYLLITPLKLTGSNLHVLISRGFIPFADDKPNKWNKYNFDNRAEFYAVVKQSVKRKSALSPMNPDASLNKPLERRWNYMELDKMALQLPYPVIDSVYLEQIGGPSAIGGGVDALFPAEHIRIQVPPSTHFGYTFEWILLALATIGIGYILQAYPGIFSRFRSAVIKE